MENPKRKCALEGCEIEFWPEQDSQRYCCQKHKKLDESRRYYREHREEMIARVQKARKKNSV